MCWVVNILLEIILFMVKRVGITAGSLVALVVFSFIAFFVKGKGPTNEIVALLSVATFLFGIIGAYIMQNRHKRLDDLRGILRMDDALYINMYKLSEEFGKKIQNRVRELIDDYVIKTIDHTLIDYPKAGDCFLKLYDYLKKIKPRNSREMEIFGEILDTIDEANKNRTYIEYLVRNTMLKFKWFTLIGLWIVILFSIFYINDNSIVFSIASILLSTSSMMFLLILRELDSLTWKERKWIWEPLDRFFRELNLVPYYPENVVEEKRVNFEEKTRVRVASYPRPYPDMRGKRVKIITVNPK